MTRCAKRAALALGLLLASELRAAAAAPGSDLRVVSTPADVGQPTFALVIGFNGRPPGASDESIQALRYADDDALAFYQLQKEWARRPSC